MKFNNKNAKHGVNSRKFTVLYWSVNIRFLWMKKSYKLKYPVLLWVSACCTFITWHILEILAIYSYFHFLYLNLLCLKIYSLVNGLSRSSIKVYKKLRGIWYSTPDVQVSIAILLISRIVIDTSVLQYCNFLWNVFWEIRVEVVSSEVNKKGEFNTLQVLAQY